ncbi:hypothetical protein ACFLZJ_00095 [Nanoarchaeota archaeon]
MLNKKAELTTQQIVVIIVLIVSFAILLFFLFRLDLGKTTDDELCYNSVVMRGKSILGGAAPPLKCNRQYICFTEDGSCETMTEPDLIEVDEAGEVYKALADEMANCWWMFGSGEIDYVGSDILSNWYCSICSQIGFDDSMIEIFPSGKVNEDYFYNEYLAQEKSGKDDLTYSEYFFGTKDFSEINKKDFEGFSLDKQYFVMTGIMSKSTWEQVVIGAVTVGAFVAIPVTMGTSTFVLGALYVGGAAAVGGTGGYFVGAIIDGKLGNTYLFPTMIEVNSEKFDSLGCKSITTLA